MAQRRRLAAAVALTAAVLASCALSPREPTGPGDIPDCESGTMRCWNGAIWACDATRKWVKIQDCAATDQFCYSNNPGRCGSDAPCCAPR